MCVYASPLRNKLWTKHFYGNWDSECSYFPVSKQKHCKLLQCYEFFLNNEIFIQASSHIFLIMVSRQNWKNKMKCLTCLRPASFWIIYIWGTVPCRCEGSASLVPVPGLCSGVGEGFPLMPLVMVLALGYWGLPSLAHCTWIGREPGGCHSPF